MANAVLTASEGTTYDDLPEVRYHFPRTYLNQIESAVGDSIVYYEPKRSRNGHGRKAYFAIARIQSIASDPTRSDHFYALIEPSSYLDFDRPVPFLEGGHFYESILRKPDGSPSKGAFGRSVRTVPPDQFASIVQAGFERRLEQWELGDAATMRVAESPFEPVVRPLIQQCLTRPFRDEAFRRRVRNAYRNTCAFSGLSLINGGGRPEVQAAHIQPVASAGPDSIRNGLALTGTLHWLFDRGLLGVDDNHRLLVSSKAPTGDLRRLIAPGQPIALPANEDEHPHPAFLRWHRENVFHG